MAELKYENIRKTVKTTPIVSFPNTTVLFEFQYGIKPMAMSREFLFRTGSSSGTLKKITLESKFTPLLYNTENYKFVYNDFIKRLSFTYGLKHEFYKNKFGKWIDIGAIRKEISVVNNMFKFILINITSEKPSDEDAYKIADESIFNNPIDSVDPDTGITTVNPYKQFLVPDISYIPESDYMNDEGFIYHIGPEDGTKVFEKCDIEVIEESNIKNTEDINHIFFVDDKQETRVMFRIYGCNRNKDADGQTTNNFDSNINHRFEDLKLEFYSIIDGVETPYDQLDNMLLTVNGVFMDYVRDERRTNIIYIPNTMRFKTIQWAGLKHGINPNRYIEYTNLENSDEKISYHNIPVESRGYNYKFDIRVIKWDNVSITKFVAPINTVSILKKETYSSNIFFLITELIFAERLEKDKFLLFNNNELMNKDEYLIDPNDPHRIKLLNVDTEYEIMYAEIYDKLIAYLYQSIEREHSEMPKLSDFVTTYDNPEVSKQQFQAYIEAMEKYTSDMIASGTYSDLHTPLSALSIVSQQFINRSYNIVKFDTVEEKDYAIKVYENKQEIDIDKPMRDKFRNIHWTPQDIVVVNGIVHRFENEYDDVFTPVLTTYLPDRTNSLKNAKAFKLEIVKEIKK